MHKDCRSIHGFVNHWRRESVTDSIWIQGSVTEIMRLQGSVPDIIRIQVVSVLHIYLDKEKHNIGELKVRTKTIC